MNKIIFQTDVTFCDKNGKQVKLSTFASSAEELIKNLHEVLDSKSKNYILKLFSF